MIIKINIITKIHSKENSPFLKKLLFSYILLLFRDFHKIESGMKGRILYRYFYIPRLSQVRNGFRTFLFLPFTLYIKIDTGKVR